MNTRQILLPVYRSLRPVVDHLHLNAIARPVWSMLWRSTPRNLVRTRHNGREWWLDSNLALCGEVYEAETVAWLRRTIKPGMTVVDIGANVGQLSLEMAELVGATGRVLSVEPSPNNLKYLSAHITANGFADRVTIVAAACCAQASGELTLEMIAGDADSIENGPQLAELGLAKNPLDTGRARVQVKVIARSVDALCREFRLQPDVLKVDVEGAELDVFRGAAATLAQFRPKIIFGFHPFAFAQPESSRRELEKIFADAGLGVENSERDCPWGLQEYTVAPAPAL